VFCPLIAMLHCSSNINNPNILMNHCMVSGRRRRDGVERRSGETEWRDRVGRWSGEMKWGDGRLGRWEIGEIGEMGKIREIRLLEF
jgi:hypothetical protein